MASEIADTFGSDIVKKISWSGKRFYVYYVGCSKAKRTWTEWTPYSDHKQYIMVSHRCIRTENGDTNYINIERGLYYGRIPIM